MKPQVIAALLIAAFGLTVAEETKPQPEAKQLIDGISAQSMKGRLSFLASDLLEGRGTPSRGLDLAAEYIASEFRRAGLEPLGDDGYFQTAEYPNRQGDKIKVRNVIGMLRGSDPVLKDTYVLVTAHYDHLGINANLVGDQIFNGADDDGSGTVSVIELAHAFSQLKVHPKRSIVFMTFYGEEKGLVGSQYYGKHPVLPIAQTIADVNLEQVGRTDDSEGPRVLEASMTGFDFSDVGAIFAAAGKEVGIAVTKHPKNSDMFFAFSDNQAIANLGVPAHTICTAFHFSDYHRVGDEWPKVDYENMAKIDKMVALGLFNIANSKEVPHWSATNPKAARYLKAWSALHPNG